ncbi:MAG: helix-turn-helix transcriptional regulator [Frankiaceae bacterium]|nr:helix-turn-helix transcriptional regulator [Frankiaceae bacterium]MBV9869554.1 helix-turn-helix transcriptional regulator [Frankiaceae bacterium]
MPRRRTDVLLPLEEAVLELAIRRRRDGDSEFHGFAIARQLEDDRDRNLTAHGTLYKVLERLERDGLLSSRWETDDEVEPNRPRRRLYQACDGAADALRRSREIESAARLRPGVATH